MEYAVCEFGARADGVAMDGPALQAAIDRCHSEGGGRVVVGPGRYRIRTVWLRSGVELHLRAGAVLQGGDKPADYDDFQAPGFRHDEAPEGNTKALLCASGAENVAVTGWGEINGAGPAFYDTAIPDTQRFYGKPTQPRPRMLLLHACRNVRLEGVALVDSPCWTVWLVDCEHVRIDGLRVSGDQRMINNDGIDIDSCRDVIVRDCVLKTGDDCIVVRAIQRVLERPAVCEDVTVTGCKLDSACQGIRVGCPSDHVIRRCSFRDMVIRGEGLGINIDNPRRYLAKGCTGRLDLAGISFADMTIDSARSPIRIHVEDGISLRRMEEISFSRIRARGGQPIIVQGSPETPVRDVCISDVRAEIRGIEPLVFRRCQGLRLDRVETLCCPAPGGDA